MLSNAVLLEFVLGRQVVVYFDKCCSPKVITGGTIGCVCCQMLSSYSYYWGTIPYSSQLDPLRNFVEIQMTLFLLRLVRPCMSMRNCLITLLIIPLFLCM